LNILLLGSGGREHALAWKISQSKHCSQLYIAPGNAGTSQHGTNVAIGVNDFDAIAAFATANKIDMVVVGPEDPLVNGIRDYFESHDALKNIPVIGPDKNGAQLEGSKDFSKQFMQRHKIPTAGYASFQRDNLEAWIPVFRNFAGSLCA
jgi:phosphoribosylamine--glycine ligase